MPRAKAACAQEGVVSSILSPQSWGGWTQGSEGETGGPGPPQPSPHLHPAHNPASGCFQLTMSLSKDKDCTTLGRSEEKVRSRPDPGLPSGRRPWPWASPEPAVVHQRAGWVSILTPQKWPWGIPPRQSSLGAPAARADTGHPWAPVCWTLMPGGDPGGGPGPLLLRPQLPAETKPKD